MAGHSKFANIQHRKGGQDKKRAQQFTKIAREIQAALPPPAGEFSVFVLHCGEGSENLQTKARVRGRQKSKALALVRGPPNQEGHARGGFKWPGSGASRWR